MNYKFHSSAFVSMIKRLFLFLFLGGLLLLPASLAHAQGDAADNVKALLISKGYDVTEVANFPDEKGNPRADTIYAMMDAASTDLDSDEVANQVVWGFVALRKYYPRVDNLLSILSSGKYLLFFGTTGTSLDDYLNKRVAGDTYWNAVRARVKIFDSQKKVYVTEKDFGGGTQGNKDQTNKDFTGGSKNPNLGTFVSSNAAGENLVLEPSTVLLPADGTSSLILIGTLRDKNYLPLSGRGVSFSYDIQGQGTSDLGAQNTDANGVARASITSKKEYGAVLFRGSTSSLNSQLTVLVGNVSTNVNTRTQAAADALTQQGYTDVEAYYRTSTSPTGEKTNTGMVVMRMASNSFDRAVYSQMTRAFGTMRTLFPSVNRLVIGLITRQNNREFALWWEVETAYWDSYLAGKLSENDFWRYLLYLGAEDSNGNEIGVGDKNFIDKNFGAGGSTREAKIKRTLESSIKKETWGEQFAGQEFVVVAGGFADAFTLGDLSGSATGFGIYQAPEFRTPLFTYKKGDPADKLTQLRLGQGQYYFAILAPTGSAAALARVTYIEHLPQ